MEKEYLWCPDCKEGEGQIYLMEVAGVDRGFYICSTCNRVWKRFRELYEPISNDWRAYLEKIGVSSSKTVVTKPLIIVEESINEIGPCLKREYLLCPNCSGGYGMIHLMEVKGLDQGIYICDECNLVWEMGKGIKFGNADFVDDYFEKKGVSPSKENVTKFNPLVIMEEDQV